MIHKIAPSVDYNYWLKRLGLKINENATKKVPKVVKPTNKITFLKKLWGLV